MKEARHKRVIPYNSIYMYLYVFAKQAKPTCGEKCQNNDVYYHLAGGVRKSGEELEMPPS